MSSSSGGTSRAGQTPSTPKVKSSLAKNNTPPSGFSLVGKNGKVIKNSTSPLSPSFQQINENPPILNTSSSTLKFNDVTDISPDSNNTPVDNYVNVLNPAISISRNKTLPSTELNTDIDMSTINYNNSIILRSFTPDYSGPVIILAESVDQNKNLGNWHPISAAKFFTTNFPGITNIKPAGHKKIKITFNTISNDNNCLNSDIPRVNGFHVNIPNNLIYSYGVIKLDTSISESDLSKVTVPLLK